MSSVFRVEIRSNADPLLSVQDGLSPTNDEAINAHLKNDVVAVAFATHCICVSGLNSSSRGSSSDISSLQIIPKKPMLYSGGMNKTMLQGRAQAKILVADIIEKLIVPL